MPRMVEGTPAAKELGIYLGQLYSMVKTGKIKNYKKDGKYVTPDGKGLTVDMDEVLAYRAANVREPKVKGEPRAKRTTTRRAASGDGEVVAERKSRRLATGTMVSFENGHNANGTKATPRYTLAAVLGSSGKLTYMDDGNHRRHYEGTQIDNTVFFTDRLSTMLARGVARIEHPSNVLGMVLLQFVVDGKMDLAESLEKWLVKNDIPVVVPEILDVSDDGDDDEETIIRGKPIMFDEEQLAGEEDTDG